LVNFQYRSKKSMKMVYLGESAQTKSFEETLASATHVANAPDDGPELTHEPSARPSPTKQRAQPPAEVSPKTPLQADMPQLPGASKGNGLILK
jgi:hypothetical protein